MAPFSQYLDPVRARVNEVRNRIRGRILGANNERLDLLMDTFYKLSAPQRTIAVAGGVGVVALFVLLAVAFYFVKVSSLERELNLSFQARHDFYESKAVWQREQSRFQKLTEIVTKKTQGVKLKPLIEQVAKETDVQIQGLSEQRVPFPSDNPLSESLQEVQAGFRTDKVSVPRLLQFLSEVERKNPYLKVQELQIRALYGQKLFFDAQAKIRGYVAVGE